MAVTIPGAKGSTAITFSVTGGSSGNYVSDFANAIATASNVGTLPSETTTPGALFEYTSPDSLNTILTTGGQYFYVSDGVSNTITLAASNETLLAGALNTVIEVGSVGGERVIFTGGTNEFIGSSTGVGGDTIVSGSGDDTIDTGSGPSTVFAGTGNTLIYLHDAGVSDPDSTVPGGGDIVNMQAGTSTVYADGVTDTVYAVATGTIIGDTGKLLITSDGGTVTVVGGVGDVSGYLTAGSDFTFTNASGDSSAVFNAGAGNETLDGAGAAGGFSFFADTTAGDASTVSDSVTGGSGADFFSTGTGMEDITAGTGYSGFEIASVAGGTITINDFSAADSVNFFGFTVAQETAYLQSNSTTAGGNLTVTLGDGTTIEFTGITSLSGHLS
jgi:hypothetical protein